MLIITGMDNSGKTTLANQVVDIFNIMREEDEKEFQILKSPGPIGEAQKDWVVQQLVSYIPENHLIYERFPILEELVYGKILRRSSVFDYNDSYFQLLKKQNPVIVYTRPSRHRIFQFEDRPQMDGIIDNKNLLLDTYDDLIFKMLSEGWRILIYDYEVSTPEKVVKAYLLSQVLEELKGGM